MILHVPRSVDISARFVGTHVWKAADKWYKNSFAGSQLAGIEGSAIRSGERYGGIVEGSEVVCMFGAGKRYQAFVMSYTTAVSSVECCLLFPPCSLLVCCWSAVNG